MYTRNEGRASQWDMVEVVVDVETLKSSEQPRALCD